MEYPSKPLSLHWHTPIYHPRINMITGQWTRISLSFPDSFFMYQTCVCRYYVTGEWWSTLREWSVGLSLHTVINIMTYHLLHPIASITGIHTQEKQIFTTPLPTPFTYSREIAIPNDELPWKSTWTDNDITLACQYTKQWAMPHTWNIHDHRRYWSHEFRDIVRTLLRCHHASHAAIAGISSPKPASVASNVTRIGEDEPPV
jgi:hypothetical protein